MPEHAAAQVQARVRAIRARIDVRRMRIQAEEKRGREVSPSHLWTGLPDPLLCSHPTRHIPAFKCLPLPLWPTLCPSPIASLPLVPLSPPPPPPLAPFLFISLTNSLDPTSPPPLTSSFTHRQEEATRQQGLLASIARHERAEGRRRERAALLLQRASRHFLARRTLVHLRSEAEWLEGKRKGRSARTSAKSCGSTSRRQRLRGCRRW